MSSSYGFNETGFAATPTINENHTALLSIIDPIVTDVLNDIIHAYGQPHRDCIGRESLPDALIFSVWTAPNIALSHPHDKKPLIVEFKEVSKRRFLSTTQVLRLEINWGNNEHITDAHRPTLFRIAEVLRDKTNLPVAVMSWSTARTDRGVARFTEDKVFEVQAG